MHLVAPFSGCCSLTGCPWPDERWSDDLLPLVEEDGDTPRMEDVWLDTVVVLYPRLRYAEQETKVGASGSLVVTGPR
jgi:hypothetical protein